MLVNFGGMESIIKMIKLHLNGMILFLFEELHIATWVHGKAPSNTIYRDFMVSDKNNQELLRASAKFALFNLRENHLV